MVAKARQEYVLRVIDPPIVSPVDEYVHPNELLIILITVIVGLVAAIMTVGTVSFMVDVARSLGRPVSA
jgi:hypothetical protein